MEVVVQSSVELVVEEYVHEVLRMDHGIVNIENVYKVQVLSNSKP